LAVAGVSRVDRSRGQKKVHALLSELLGRCEMEPCRIIWAAARRHCDEHAPPRRQGMFSRSSWV